MGKKQTKKKQRKSTIHTLPSLSTVNCFVTHLLLFFSEWPNTRKKIKNH